jgi:hypothetical protein
MLHHLVDGAERDLPPTREAMLEDKIAHALDRRGTMTARELHQCIRGYASREISGALEGMTKAERLTVTTHGKTRLYAVPIDTVQPDASEEETKNEEIPF